MLGVEHILSGYDHLAFVIGLLFLVGFNHRLVATITASTLAHSLTLALAALSIMLVAGEALHTQPTLSRRWPVFVRGRTPALYTIGGVAAYWSIGRIAAMIA